MTAEQLALITTDPQVMSGQAVLAGTRVPASVILDCLAAGMTSHQILAEYPTISEAGIRAAAALRRAARPRGTRPPPPAAVKVKLDGNVPRSVQTLLADSGHDVDTVTGEGMTGAADPDVVRAATQAGRLLITLDRSMADARRHPPGGHAGILVLRLPDQSAPAVLQAVTTLLDRHHLDRLAGTVSVAQRGLLRIRRP